MDYYIDGDKPLKEPHETVSHKTMFLLVGATAIIVIILILIVLSSSQINSKASLSLGDQDNIKFSGSLITNGELVDTFASNGEKGRITLNKNNNGRIVLKSNGLNNIGFGNGRIIIRDKYGNIVGEFDDGAYFDENGNLVLDWDWDDFNFDGGDDYEEFDFWVEFYDEDSNSELILNIPLDIIFSDFIGTGCIQINKTDVISTTVNGFLEVPVIIRNNCNTLDSLKASVAWTTLPKGSVEVIFPNDNGSVLMPAPLPIYLSPEPGDYFGKIIFYPNKANAGEKTFFTVNFELENSIEGIDFEVIMDNLTQCIKVTTEDSVISDFSDKASITIDRSDCASQKIDFFVCDNDAGCSGGVEGEIIPSTNYFSLTDNNPVTTLYFERTEIPGVYGVKIHARAQGSNKIFIDEKEITVKPTDELLVPDKFVVSVFPNSKDLVTVRNKALADDVDVTTSVCNLYNYSFGITGVGTPLLGAFVNDKSWLMDLYSNPERFSGTGFYQASFKNALQNIDQARYAAYSTSVQENTKIRKAYDDVVISDASVETIQGQAALSLARTEEFNNAIGDVTDSAEVTLASQLVSLTSSISTLATSSNSLCTSLETAQTTAISGCASVCPEAMMTCEVNVVDPVELAMGDACGGLATSAYNLATDMSSLYSIYQQIDALLDDSETIDAEASLSSATELNTYATQAREHSSSALEYVQLAIEAAAVDSLDSASSDDLDAHDYLELALAEQQQVVDLVTQARASQVSAQDSVTVLIDTDDQTVELIASGASLLLQLISSVGLFQTDLQTVQTEVSTAQTGITTTTTTASANCNPPVKETCCGCCEGQLAGIQSELSEIQGQISEQSSSSASILSSLNLVNTAYQTWQALSADYGDELAAAMQQNMTTIAAIDAASAQITNTAIDLQTAITAAQNLSTLELKSSLASAYTEDFSLSSPYHEFDKERLVGLIGSLVSNGFVNGAYGGGVYLDGCDDDVTLTLPDYRINLLQDVKPIVNSVPDVIAQWQLNNPKVFGVFEEQEVGISFANSGLNKNTYGIIELVVDEHEHATPTIASGKFGPFNITDSFVDEKNYKYHFKFNAVPRKVSRKEKDPSCEKGLMFGEATSDALPKIILNWDWDAINLENAQTNYLDAVQLSILLSKNLSAIDEFLSRTGTSCPDDPSSEVFDLVVPLALNTESITDCFLPLTTRFYDGKPALYYQVPFSSSSSGSSELVDEESLINSADELLALLDFNALLMRDGYGTDMQNDFAKYYSTTLLKTDPSFVDPSKGMYRYFKSTSNLYFTSYAENFSSDYKFYLPDAGRYNIKTIIDFDKMPLIEGGTTNARILFDLSLKEAINEDYSPFYYTPFDGGVGLNTSDNRMYYGSSLTQGSDFGILRKDGIVIENNQRDSFVKLNYEEEDDFFELNAFNSKRAKLLDYYFDGPNSKIVYYPTIATPLLFSISGTANTSSGMTYTIMDGARELNGNTNNLFLLTAINNCKGFYGEDITKYMNNVPDTKVGNQYGFGFNDITNPGKVFLKSVAYSPNDSAYAISFFNGSLQSTDIAEQPGQITLDGINGMEYNDGVINEYIESLHNLFEAVGDGSVCVSRLGTREIYWWPEDKLFERENIDGEKLKDKIIDAQGKCIIN